MLGPDLKPFWITMEGIPLHPWEARVFHRLGECLGVVLEIDEEANRRKRVDKVRLLTLRDPLQFLPPSLPSDVDGVLFFVNLRGRFIRSRQKL